MGCGTSKATDEKSGKDTKAIDKDAKTKDTAKDAKNDAAKDTKKDTAKTDAVKDDKAVTSKDAKVDNAKDDKNDSAKEAKADASKEVKVDSSKDAKVPNNVENSTVKSETKDNVVKNVEKPENTENLISKIEESKPKLLPLVVFGVFPPGVNKHSVLSTPLSKKGFTAVSTKEVIKDAISRKVPEADAIEKSIHEGVNIPGDTMTKLLIAYLSKQAEKGVNRFYVSGFPRCEDNSKTWLSLAKGIFKVVSLIYVSYTRKEYENELEEMEQVTGEKVDFESMTKKYDYFLTNTRNVDDDFGTKKLIKLSATLDDGTIQSKVFKNDLFKILDN